MKLSPPKVVLWNYVACAILLFGTLLLFSRTLQQGFLDLDDPDYVIQNPHVLAGLTWDGVHWALTSGDSANWHPLTWLSLILDAQLYGDFPRGYHFTNNLLHAVNAVIAFLVFLKMTSFRKNSAASQLDCFWPSLFCAALFAWHPLRVESVAWVAERKDVLSGLFFLLTLLAYTHYIGKSGWKAALFYLLTLLTFSLGLMAKPMLVTVPFLLFLLDWWSLGRINQGTMRLHLFEKIPFVILSLSSCIITYIVQKNWGAVVESQPLLDRLANAAVSVVRYLSKFFWPTDLAVVYPIPPHWPAIVVTGSVVFIVVLTAIAWQQSRRRPWLIIGWLWFIGMLVPVLGLVQVGLQSMADRYTYLPIFGVLLVGAWSLREIKFPMLWKIPICIIVLSACTLQTWHQIGFWHDPQTLYRHALAVSKNNYPAECYLGTSLLNSNRPDEACAHFHRAIELKPDFNDARFKLGIALAQAGHADEAMTEYGELLKINPRHALAEYNIGFLLLEENQPADAVRHFQAALQKKPNYDPALVGLGTAEAKLSHPAKAIAYFEQAIALRPNNAVAHYNYANALADLHRGAESIAQYKMAVQFNPGFAAAHCNFADALDSLGRHAEACAQYRQALALEPENSAAIFGLATALEDSGKTAPATACYEKCLALDPDNAGAHYNLGTIFLDQNDPRDALSHFDAAMRIAPDNDSAFVGAGLALEKLGREKEAIAVYHQAIAIAPEDAQAHCCLGIALRRTGDFSGAVTEDEIALQLNPNLPGLAGQLALAQRNLTAAATP